MMKLSLFFAICVALVFSIGLLMVYNTTSAQILDRYLEVDMHQILLKQILYASVGIALGFFLYFFGYRNVIEYSPYLFYFCIFLLTLVFVPKIGMELNGAKRWIGLWGHTFQPSELAKYFIPFYFIHWVARQKTVSFKVFLKVLAILAIPLSLIFFQPDNGTAIIIVTTLVILFFLTKINLRYWALPLFSLIVVGVFFAAQMPHVRNRIKIYLHPELDLKGRGHQPYQAKIAAGSGKVFGRGLGESLQKLNYLPEARSDYIAAIYAEEFGFVGISALVVLYMMISFFGFFIALKTKEIQGFYLASILTFLISFQAFLNLGVVSGLLPSKGTTLPFFSQGGSSLIVNIVAFFLLINIAHSRSKICLKT